MILRGYDEQGKAIHQTAKEAKWEQVWGIVEREQTPKNESFDIAHYNELVSRAQGEMIVCAQMLEAIEAGTLKTLSIPSRDADVNLIHPEHFDLIAQESQQLATLSNSIERIGVKEPILSTWYQQLIEAGYQADLKPYGLVARLSGQLIQITADLKPLARLLFQTSTDTVYSLSSPPNDGNIISYVKDAEQTVRERLQFRLIAKHISNLCGRTWKPRWSADRLILDRIDGFGIAVYISIPSNDTVVLSDFNLDSDFESQLPKLLSLIK